MSELTKEQVESRFLILKANTTHQLYDCTRVLEQHEAALRAKVEALEKENFRLAAIICEAPYGDAGGSKRCKTVATLTAERDRLRDVAMYLIAWDETRRRDGSPEVLMRVIQDAQAALRGEGG